MMLLDIGQEKIRLNDSHLLGIGGEAKVYRYQDQAIKVFHSLKTLQEYNPGLPVKELQRRMQDKSEKLQQFPIQQVPANVLAPLELAWKGKKLAGYVMHCIEQGQDLRLLSQRRFRQGVISNAQVTQLFIRLWQTLDSLHQQQIVVGDLNDNNVLFAHQEIWLIDTDSMQFGNFCCPVATDKFLDPHLYGTLLGTKPVFSPESDFYAFAVMLLSSWLYVGPYGGKHKTIKTWLKRAQAQQSIFSDEVQYPKSAIPYEILPDELLQDFSMLFDQGKRFRFSLQKLQDLEWQQCSCGLEYARSICPCGQQKQHQVIQERLISHQSCTARILFNTQGRMVYSKLHNNTLYYLYYADGILYREDNQPVLQGPLPWPISFAIQGNSTWIAHAGQALALENGKVLKRIPASNHAGQTQFSVCQDKPLNIKQQYLYCGQQRMGSVIPGQTWFASNADYGFGFYRTKATLFGFLVEPGKAHLQEVTLPITLRGRILENHCVFSASNVLFMCAYEQQGQARFFLSIIQRSNQKVLAHTDIRADQYENFSCLQGKLLAGDKILSSSDRGLALFTLNAQGLQEDKLYSETEAYMQNGSILHAGADNSIYVVNEQQITLLQLNS